MYRTITVQVLRKNIGFMLCGKKNKNQTLLYSSHIIHDKKMIKNQEID